jgi:hypothetical protein
MNRFEALRRLAKKWRNKANELDQDIRGIPIAMSVPVELFPAPFDYLKKRIQSEQLQVCARALEDEIIRTLSAPGATLRDLAELGGTTNDHLKGLQEKYTQFGYLTPEEIEWLIRRAERTFIPSAEQESIFDKQIQQERKRAQTAEDRSRKYRAALEYARGTLVRHREKPNLYPWDTSVKELWDTVDQALGQKRSQA